MTIMIEAAHGELWEGDGRDEEIIVGQVKLLLDQPWISAVSVVDVETV